MMPELRVRPGGQTLGSDPGVRPGGQTRGSDPAASRRGTRLDLVTGTCLIAACTSRTAQPSSPLPRHLLIVTIDTLRADHLGSYGNHAVATPNMDRWAREGAIALNATVHAPLTRP